jgi:cytochrome b561
MSRYPAPLIAMHWLTALAVVTAYVTSGNPAKAKDVFDALMGQVHVISGLAVLALVALRIPARLLLGVPPTVPAPSWQTRAAYAAHVALYGLMLLVPLAGWAALADKTTVFTLIGGFSLPLPDPHATWVKLLGDAHQTLGNVFIWLAGLHAAAALMHHIVMRDTTLVRMLPLKALSR